MYRESKADVGNFAPSTVRCGRGFRHCGFTMVEMLTVIAIITLLVAILLPAVNAAREGSRSTACMNHLRQFGAGLTQYCDKHGAYCTGSFDWSRDGAVTEIGWVADMVDLNILPGQMLCPSNSAQISRTYVDLLEADVNDITKFDADCRDHFGSDPRKNPDGTYFVNPCKQLEGFSTTTGTDTGTPLAPLGDPRKKVVEEEIYDLGYNTNYAASWVLVRGGVNVTNGSNGNPRVAVAACAETTLDTRNVTFGPLTRARVESSQTSENVIPLLGCAAQSVDPLPMAIGSLAVGSPTTVAMTRGPVVSDDHTSSLFAAFVSSLEIFDWPQFQSSALKSGANGWWAGWTKHALQDYRQFAPVHRGSANILFLDGSVRSYVDKNDDGYLNNGFPGGVGEPAFGNDEIEIEPTAVLSRWSLSEN